MTLASNLAAVRARIARAAAACGRDPASVELLAVSKTHGAAVVRAALELGLRQFGENRVQELVPKADDLADTPAEWHMIGSLQTNKVRDLVDVPGLSMLHSLDRLKLADALQVGFAVRASALDCLLQVNATGEPNKHGASAGEAIDLLAHVRAECPLLRPRGLMAMGPLHGDPAPVFAAVAALRERLRDLSGEPLPILSLGMSADLEAAVAAGSTMVRVGTALFGPRE